MLRTAYAIVGSMRDAEDIVQETFLKWLSAGPEKIRNTGGYFVKSIYNNATKFKSSANFKNLKIEDPHELVNRIAEYEPIADLKLRVGEAFDVIHSKLKPLEMAVLVLRESFSFDYEQLQEIFDKSAENIRQIVSRAKQKLLNDSGSILTGTGDDTIKEKFDKAASKGMISEFVDHLMNDISHRFKK